MLKRCLYEVQCLQCNVCIFSPSWQVNFGVDSGLSLNSKQAIIWATGDKWGLRCQKQLSQAGISNCISQNKTWILVCQVWCRKSNSNIWIGTRSRNALLLVISRWKAMAYQIPTLCQYLKLIDLNPAAFCNYGLPTEIFMAPFFFFKTILIWS